MMTLVRFFLLILLLGITACSNSTDKTLSDYEQSLCRADSLVHNGSADSTRMASLFSDLHREYNQLKESSGTRLVRITPLPLRERLLMVSVCVALMMLVVWLWRLQARLVEENKRRDYTVSLSENEQHLLDNQREMSELEKYMNLVPEPDTKEEEVKDAYACLKQRDDELQKENGILRTRLKEYEKRPQPRDLELLEKQGERLRQLDEQMRNLTSTLIDHDGLVEQLRLQPRYLTDADWEYLKQLLDRMYAGFTQRLSACFPQLTTSDVQLCLLIRLRFSNAQVAAFTAVSPSSVSQQKFRLKKRLQQMDESLFVNGGTVETFIWGC